MNGALLTRRTCTLGELDETRDVRKVAYELWRWAEALRHDDQGVDRFARSAFNRYYYAVFWVARDLHRHIYPNQRVPPHGQFPQIVRDNLYTRFRDAIRDAVRSGLIERGEGERMKHRVRELTRLLHDLLNEGYGLRVTADYDPEVPIVTQNGSLKLENVSLEAASRWPDKADRVCGGILREWRQLGN